MDFKKYLEWFRPNSRIASDTDAIRIERSRTRNDLIRVLPTFTEKDGRAVYEFLEKYGLLSAVTFQLWLWFITRKRNHF